MAKPVEDRIFCEVEDDYCDRREFVRGENKEWIHVELDGDNPLVAEKGHLISGTPVELYVVRSDVGEVWTNSREPIVRPRRPKRPQYKRPG